MFDDCCITGRRCTVEVIIVSRKVFRCFSESALCSVSSGRTVGAPASINASYYLKTNSLSGRGRGVEQNEPGISTTRVSCRLGALLEPLMTAVLKRLVVEPRRKE